MKTRCTNCGNYFEAKKSSAKYCSGACRTYAYRKRHGMKEPTFLKKEKTLSGIGDDGAAQPATTANRSLAPIRQLGGVVLKSDEYVKTVKETVQVRSKNPTYADYESRLQVVQTQIQLLESEKRRLIKRFNTIANNNPEASAVVAGAALGAATYAITTKEKSPDYSKLIWMGIFGGALGYIGGKAMKKSEQQQASELRNIKAFVGNVETEVIGWMLEEQQIKYYMSKTQKWLIKPVERTKQVIAKRKPEEQGMKPLDLSGLAKVPEKAMANKIPEVKTMQLDDFQKVEFKPLGFTQEWEHLGNPEMGFRMLIWGENGNGKSTYAIKFAEYLANNHGFVLYNSSEEELGLSLQNKTKNIKSKWFALSKARTFDELYQLAQNPSYAIIFIDSINDMNISYEQFKTLLDQNPNKSFIYVMQVTKNGSFRGDNRFAHEAGIKVQVKDRQPIVEKTRY